MHFGQNFLDYPDEIVNAKWFQAGKSSSSEIISKILIGLVLLPILPLRLFWHLISNNGINKDDSILGISNQYIFGYLAGYPNKRPIVVPIHSVIIARSSQITHIALDHANQHITVIDTNRLSSEDRENAIHLINEKVKSLTVHHPGNDVTK